ncbi:PhnD/SsuA/transferrin family substrate-binding protein [Shinella sp. CPCC 101442]|uniref:ABC transporter substrate-binding protein n=1 Tax=Shinella sp. CPCC 101442 TaxID=2932265 RepID=UPI002152FF34|nr:PhnD/SsuA/transferrin family substrate-binding protein [Shinella sp. CPCC 101442]MCR6502363.1 PhnD/SsuA/transferrin family substrate-binding protein [Shinella sp. CPCC 101442]
MALIRLPKLGLAATIAVIVLGAQAFAEDSKTITLVIGQNGQELQPGWEASGIWKDAPYKLEFATFPNAVENATALAAGNVDVSYFAQFTAIQAQASSNPDWTKETVPYKSIVVAATADTVNHERFVTLASGASGIGELTADSVRGKRWASSPGATNFLLYLQTLKHLGLKPADVVPVTLNNEAGALAVLHGEVDLVSGPIDFYDQALADGGKVISKSGEVGPGSPGGLLANSQSLSDPAKDAAIRDLIARYVAYQDWYNTHPAEAQDALVKVRKLSPESAKFIWAYTRVRPQPITGERIDEARSIASVVHEFGAIGKAIDASLTYDARYTDTIEEALKTTNYDANLQGSLTGN